MPRPLNTFFLQEGAAMASKQLTPLDDNNFAATIKNSPTPVLVDFGAAWCPPCRAIEPHVEALAKDFQGRLAVHTMDTDVNQATAAKYGIRGLPTLILFKNGLPVAQLLGAVPRSKLDAMVQPHVEASGS